MENATVKQETLEQTGIPPAKTLSDFINEATILNYREVLPGIIEATDTVVREAHISALAKRLNVSRSVIQEAIKETEKEIKGTLKAVFPELVDLVVTEQGKVAYLIIRDGIPDVVDHWKTTDGQTFIPPEQKHIPFKMGRAEKVLEHFRNDKDREVVEDISTYLKRFSFLPEREWAIIVMCVLLSYLQSHSEVRYVPVVYFYAVAERGKSRTAKSMLSIMYRGIHLVDLRPANIIRFAENFNATLFFDCTEVWKTAEKYDCADILLGRFEKGTQVTRVLNPDAGPFKDQTSFDIYGSTIVATNEPANTTFESRCLTLTMPNRPGEYEDPKPELGIELKERLIAFRARNMTREFPPVASIPGISGRLWDITKPLFQLCQLFNPEGAEPIKSLLLEMVGKKVEVKKGTLEGKIVAAIADIFGSHGANEVTFKFKEITERVNNGMPEKMKYSPQRLGRVVESLSIKTRTVQGLSHVTITKEELDRLKIQYGLTEEKAAEPEAKVVTLKPVTQTPQGSSVRWAAPHPDAGNSCKADHVEAATEKPRSSVKWGNNR